jgi:2-polyprenyl-3-methyl-5-hydroxy-6-metoxy-1,4-benzoquinol methylase
MIPELLAIFERDDPKSLKSIQQARAVAPQLFDAVGERILTTMGKAFPERSLGSLVEAYSIYTFEQNRLQARYERTGKYPLDTHAAVDSAVYQNHAVMTDYMGSLLLTQFLWPHHLEIVRYFQERFVPLLGEDCQILEMAPGHGFYGRLALERKPCAQLLGVDISPLCVSLAATLAEVEGYAGRARYQQGDALQSGKFLPHCNAIIAGELLEHLDQPRLLIEAVARQLSPGGLAFVTAAITAAAADHVHEFKDADEVFVLLEGTALKLVDSLLVSPPIIRPGTTRIPRVLAMVLKL